MDVQYHFTHEKYKTNDIDIGFIASKDQLADTFTKPLPRERFTLQEAQSECEKNHLTGYLIEYLFRRNVGLSTAHDCSCVLDYSSNVS